MKIEPNNIYLGDCLELMKYIPDKSVDLTVTSPPYDNLRTYNGYEQGEWEYAVGGNLTGHPAVFPEQLAKDHIISWSSENDTVLDCFMGSGTTGKMAKLLNRNFIGIEISEEYFEIAKKRIESVKTALEHREAELCN